MTTVALFGAAGNMGTRISERLRDDPEYRMLYVEADEAGEARLRERGLEPTSRDDAVAQADVVILAVPDVFVGRVAEDIVSSLKSGAMVMTLDPAAPYGGKLPAREDISYFVTHPAHPPQHVRRNSSKLPVLAGHTERYLLPGLFAFGTQEIDEDLFRRVCMLGEIVQIDQRRESFAERLVRQSDNDQGLFFTDFGT